MNLRHAAVSALVGWYLMVPPAVHTGAGVDLHQDAPLGDWETLASFDSADTCTRALMAYREAQDKEEEKFMKALEQYHRGEADKLPKDFDSARWAQSLCAKCIATDDPRLKEK